MPLLSQGIWLDLYTSPSINICDPVDNVPFSTDMPRALGAWDSVMDNP